MADARDLGGYIFDGFVRRGLNPAQAAALAGNFKAESSFDPRAWNPKEQAGGLMQWRLDRLAGLQDFAAQTGRPVDDPDLQMDWTLAEMTQGKEARNAAAFLAAQDPYTANAALRQVIRYAPGSERARLEYTLAYAPPEQGQPRNAMMAPAPANRLVGYQVADAAPLRFPGQGAPLDLMAGDPPPANRLTGAGPEGFAAPPPASLANSGQNAPMGGNMAAGNSAAPGGSLAGNNHDALFEKYFGGGDKPADAGPGSPDQHEDLFQRFFGDETARLGDAEGSPAAAPPGAGMSAKDRYDAALENIRAEYYPEMDDARWSEYAKMAMAPYGFKDLITHGATFGLTDEAGALVGAVPGLLSGIFGGAGFGDRWADFKELEEARRDYGRELAGGAGTAAEIAGGMAGLGPRAIAGAVSAVAGKAPGIVSQAIEGAKAGMGYGAAYGAGSTDGDLDQRAIGAGEGALGGALGGAAGAPIAAGIGKVAGAVAPAVRNAMEAVPIIGKPASAALAPTVGRAAPVEAAAAVKGNAQALYKQAENAVLDATATPLLVHDMRAMFRKEGLVDPDGRYSANFPKARAAIRQMEKFEGQPMTMPQFQRLEETIQNAIRSNNAGESRIGRMMLGELDGFLESLPPAAFSKGGAAEAKAWLAGRSEYARFKKMQRAETLNRNAAYHPQGPIEGLRAEVRNILKSDKKRKDYTAAEIAEMDKFLKGGTADALLSFISGGGVMPSGILGAVTAGPVGAAVGAGAKMAAGATANAIRGVEASQMGNALLRSAAGMPPIPPYARPGAATREAVNLLMQRGGAQEGQKRKPVETINRLLATGR